MIFNLFLTTMVFFQTQPKSDVFPYKCIRTTFLLVRHLSQSDVCTSPKFVPIRRLHCPTVVPSDVCTIWRFCWSDVCTSPKFVPVQRLSQSDVCTSPKFVPVWRLHCPTFVPSDVCTISGSVVWTRTDEWFTWISSKASSKLSTEKQR